MYFRILLKIIGSKHERSWGPGFEKEPDDFRLGPGVDIKNISEEAQLVCPSVLAMQDYAEEERSNASGGFWMERGIEDALDLNARNVSASRDELTRKLELVVLSRCRTPTRDTEAQIKRNVWSLRSQSNP